MSEDYRKGYKDGFDDGYEKGKREATLPNPLKPKTFDNYDNGHDGDTGC